MPVVMRWNTGNLSIGVAIPWSMRHVMAAVHQTLVLVHGRWRASIDTIVQ
jgi:hypothetical protein